MNSFFVILKIPPPGLIKKNAKDIFEIINTELVKKQKNVY